MGEKSADTEREITRLRTDMTAALAEVERRVTGGWRAVAASEARIGGTRATRGMTSNPPLLGAVGVVAAGAVAYGVYLLVRRAHTPSRPQNPVARGVRQVGAELSQALGGRLHDTRRELERALPQGVLLKLEPEDGGYVRVSDARLEPHHKKRGQSAVIKKLVWAALLSIFMAVGSVIARRVADAVWRAMTREEPPTSKSAAAS